MDAHIENLMSEFKNIKPTLNVMKVFVVNYLKKKLFDEKGMLIADISGRVKTENSLMGKLLLKGHKYKGIKDITDLFGARIVTFYADEVDLIASFIEKEFDIDYENSIDKRKIYEVDRFGYMSLHYVCKIPQALYYDKDYPMLNEIKFEIQMRTCLQHVWATIFHDTGYKSDVEVPKEYIRRLSRLEGLLEIADAEFLSLRNEINAYRSKVSKFISEGKFEEISFNIDSYTNYLSLNPYQKLIDRIASIKKCDVEEGSYLRYYSVFVDMGVKYLNEIEDMRVKNSDDAYKLALLQLEGTDIDIISSTIAMQNIITMHIVKNAKDSEEMKLWFSSLFGSNRVNDQFLNKIIERTKVIISV